MGHYFLDTQYPLRFNHVFILFLGGYRPKPNILLSTLASKDVYSRKNFSNERNSANSFANSKLVCLCTMVPIYKMVARNMMRTYRVKSRFREKKIWM